MRKKKISDPWDNAESIPLLIIAFISAMIFIIIIAGCQRGDVKITPVIAGQPAPHAGYNISPELWVDPNMPVRMTGVIIWIKGTEPDWIFADE